MASEKKKPLCKFSECQRESFWRGYCPSHAGEGLNSPEKQSSQNERAGAIPALRFEGADERSSKRVQGCDRLRNLVTKASNRDVLACTRCKECKSRKEELGGEEQDEYVVVVFRVGKKRDVKDVSVFEFAQGQQAEAVNFLGGTPPAVSAEPPEQQRLDVPSGRQQSTLRRASSPPSSLSVSLPNKTKAPNNGALLSASPHSASSSSPTFADTPPSTATSSKKLRRNTVSSLSRGQTSDVSYLASSDLRALDGDVSKKIPEIINSLSNGDWKAEFNALDDVRRLCMWHAPLLTVAHLTTIVRKVEAQVSSNLRSSVRKNGVLCLQAMFCTLGKGLEAHLNLLIPSLLRRTVEQNNFLAGEAEVALRAATMTSSPAKTIRVFLQVATTTHSKEAPVKAQAVKCLAWCVEQYGPSLLDKSAVLGEVVKCVAPVLYDRSKAARAFARDCVVVLVRLLQASEPKEDKEDAGEGEAEWQAMVAQFQSVLDKSVASKYQERMVTALAAAGASFNSSGELTLAPTLSPPGSPVASPPVHTRQLTVGYPDTQGDGSNSDDLVDL